MAIFARTRMPIGCVRRFDTVSNQQAECVDQDVAFASPYTLVRVEATSATTLGRLDRLAIHDYQRWTNCPSGMAPGLLVEHAMQVFLAALADPDTVEIMLNAEGTLWQKRLGKPMRQIGTMSATQRGGILSLEELTQRQEQVYVRHIQFPI